MAEFVGVHLKFDVYANRQDAYNLLAHVRSLLRNEKEIVEMSYMMQALAPHGHAINVTTTSTTEPSPCAQVCTAAAAGTTAAAPCKATETTWSTVCASNTEIATSETTAATANAAGGKKQRKKNKNGGNGNGADASSATNSQEQNWTLVGKGGKKASDADVHFEEGKRKWQEKQARRLAQQNGQAASS